MDINWVPIDATEYIKHVRCRTRVIWLGAFLDPGLLEAIFRVNGIQTRGCCLQSGPEWLEFVSSCYSLGCLKEGDNWMSVNGEKKRFLDYISTTANDPTYFGFDETKFVDPIFCTVFDTRKNKRLIVDGLHRANALTLACNEEKSVTIGVLVVECFGDNVDVIYPCDIHQLPL